MSLSANASSPIPASSAPLLQAEGVTVRFDACERPFDVVRDVSFTLHPGRTLCLVGESGCGKSMTALSLLRLIPEPGSLAAGRILFEGRDLAELSESAMERVRGRDIGMIFQEPMTSLNPVIRVGEQVAEPLMRHLRLPKKAALAEAVSYTHLRSRLTKKAVFFPGCYVNDYDPQTGKDLVFMLEKAGYEVIVPEFECCGLPMVANGFFDDARAAASRNVDTLAALVSSGDVPVLTVCPSCQLMLKQEYAEYFPELGKHESIVPHVQDACEFLIGLIESGELDIDVREDATKLVYHAPCHLRAQGIGKPGLDLLRMASANVEDARSGCCGISGSYGFKKEKYDVAASVGSDLFKAVKDSACLLYTSRPRKTPKSCSCSRTCLNRVPSAIQSRKHQEERLQKRFWKHRAEDSLEKKGTSPRFSSPEPHARARTHPSLLQRLSYLYQPIGCSTP